MFINNDNAFHMNVVIYIAYRFTHYGPFFRESHKMLKHSLIKIAVICQ